MGFIDAYTYLVFDGVFVSAQTGNVIVMSVKAFSEQWLESIVHLAVFAGFAVGTFVGEAVIEKINSQSLKQFRIFLLVQGVLLLILSLFQLTLPNWIMVFLLGTLSGYELSVFRKIGVTTINNGIMTGNTKNMMHSLYKLMFDGEKKAGIDFRNLLLGLFIFIVGVICGTLVARWDSEMILWTAFILNILFSLWLYILKYKKRTV
ncbi:DUF1275 domain-containing protein [Virgibacillus sp. MSJ-26]|nr:DUF1275 domain-containing protein [Virgibacillus sp. MSJ-26]